MDGMNEAPANTTVPSWAPRKLFDVTEWERMAEAGVLGEDDPYELIEGEIIEMAAVGGPHIGVVMALCRLLILASGDQFAVSPQNPLRLDHRNELEPDVVLLRPRADNYVGRTPPTAEDAALVIEVSDSSLRYDRLIKTPLYARHGIPELWIVDVAAGEIEVCRAPSEAGYADVTRVARGGVIEPLALPGLKIAVAEAIPAGS